MVGYKAIVPNPESLFKSPTGETESPCVRLLAAEAHRLEPDEFRVYVALALRAGPEGVAIRVEDLCEIVLLGERKVRYVLKLLERAGFIKRVGWTRNRRYLINPVSDWVPPEQLPLLREEVYTNRRRKEGQKKGEKPAREAKKGARPKSAPSSKASSPRKRKPPAQPGSATQAPPPQPVEGLREYLPLTRAVLEAIRSPDGVSEARRAFVLALAKGGRWESFHRLLRRRARDSAAWTAWLEGIAQNYAEKGKPYLEAFLKALDRLEARPEVKNPFAWLPKVAQSILERNCPDFRRWDLLPEPDLSGITITDYSGPNPSEPMSHRPKEGSEPPMIFRFGGEGRPSVWDEV